jgi:hypothetical protein
MYFGTYSTNDSDKTLTYHIERSSWPNFEGQDQKRIVTIKGGVAPVFVENGKRSLPRVTLRGLGFLSKGAVV